MRHSRAIGALISTVVALGALVAPVAAGDDGITFEKVLLQDEGVCVLEVRKDGTTVATVPSDWDWCSDQYPLGGPELGPVVRLAGDGLVYFQWGAVRWDDVCIHELGCFWSDYYVGKTWVTDGTEAGTVERPDICPDVWLVGKTVLYTRCGYVWSWVRDADTTALAQQPGYPTAVLGDRLIYPFRDSRGEELWAVIGGGTAKLLRDIRPGPKGSGIKDFRVRWGRLYFTANDGNGFARWVTDGTREGTRRVNW